MFMFVTSDPQKLDERSDLPIEHCGRSCKLEDSHTMSRNRDRVAPMDFSYDSPRDPGVFGLLPNKRVHLDTVDGESIWAPSPQNSPHPPSNAPLLFSSSTKASFGFSQYQNPLPRSENAGYASNDEQPVVSAKLANQMHQDLLDVDMEDVESPRRDVKPVQSLEDIAKVTDGGPSSAQNTAPVLVPSSRPVSLNAVKKSAKQLRHAQEHGMEEGGRASDVASASGSRIPGKGRKADGGETLVLWEGDEGEDSQANEDGDDSIESEISPLVSRLRRRRSPRRSHLRQDNRLARDPLHPSLAPQFHGNQYHLHMPLGGGGMNLARSGSAEGKEVGAGGVGGINHSELPYIFLGYLQFVFNAGVVAICLYLVITFILTIRHDVKQKMGAFSSEIMQEISTCTSLYIVNRCEPATRIPAMETACLEWESCMSRDPTVVGHARVGALTFANVITTFVDELSWKTIFFILAFSTCIIFITNSALFNLRAKHASSHVPSSHMPAPQHVNQDHGLRPHQQFQWPPAVQDTEKRKGLAHNL